MQMPSRIRLTTWLVAAAAFASPWLMQPLRGQDQQPAQQGQQQGQPAQNDPRRNLQVGVPDGRGAGGPARGNARDTGPARPIPRYATGRVMLGGATPAEKGVWQPGPVVGNPLGMENIPYQPWARALAADRDANELEPHTRCKASGALRQFLTPYGVEILELPEMQRAFIFDIGGPHTFRTIYMDGRSHPSEVEPTYYGHSIGWWDGDTLVVDTVGYNEGFWMDRGRLPHTNLLHTIEKFTRTAFNTMRYEYTVDDPGAYTKAFTGAMNLRWEAGTELFEYQCQQANYAHELMLGEYKKVDRTSLIVP
jgi:hypothetical protein